MATKHLATTCAVMFFMSQLSIFACSFVGVTYPTANGMSAVTERAMDFPTYVAGKFVYGAVGETNISNVNIVEGLSDDDVVQWTNTFQYVGAPDSSVGNLSDGLNECGLYIGLLYLGGSTAYPEYNAKLDKKAISVFDLPNYFLGTCATVEDALNSLDQFQVVKSVLQPIPEKYLLNPLHFVLYDKTGDSALIEWINGEAVIYRNLDVVANSPDYAWQMKNYNERSKYFVPHNTHVKWDGQYMNGSGLAGKNEENQKGLPGDFTSPSRFVRGKAIYNFFPKAQTKNDALYMSERIINSMQVPVGANEAATTWISLADLNEATYYFKNLIEFRNDGKTYVTTNNAAPEFFYKINVKDPSDEIKNDSVKAKIIRRKFIPADKIPPYPTVSPTLTYDASFNTL